MSSIGSKEERKKRKKKIEVSNLFRSNKKRPSESTKASPAAAQPAKPDAVIQPVKADPAVAEDSVPAPTKKEKQTKPG